MSEKSFRFCASYNFSYRRWPRNTSCPYLLRLDQGITGCYCDSSSSAKPRSPSADWAEPENCCEWGDTVTATLGL